VGVHAQFSAEILTFAAGGFIARGHGVTREAQAQDVHSTELALVVPVWLPRLLQS